MAGRRFRRFNEGTLNAAGSIRLLTKGALKVICRPALQAGEVIVVQSPASIAGSGDVSQRFRSALSVGLCPGTRAKKKSLFLTIGPPILPPYWLRFSVPAYCKRIASIE